MDLDLSDDQVALRDGIASMLAARVPIERVRAGFDRAMFDELAGAGVFSLRADGFSWADCVVVFEQLGRFCVPGPLVDVAAARRRPDRRASSIESPPIWIEHLDALDVLLVGPMDDVRERRPDARSRRERVALAARSVHAGRRAPSGSPRARRSASSAATGSCAGTALTAAFQLGLADRLTELAVAYAKERVQFDRPIGGFQAIKHMLADMLDAHRGRARRGVQRGRGARRDADARGRAAGSSTAPRSSPATPRSRTARPRRRCSAAWASRGRSTCTST